MEFSVVPITEQDAREMIGDTRIPDFLRKKRRYSQVELEPLIRIILGVSKLIEEHPQIVELDLNPIILKNTEAIAVDSLIVVGENKIF